MEVWKRIKDYETYEVSNMGNVRNALNGKALKKPLNTGGYPTVTLCGTWGRKNKTVHRLVAEAFIPNIDDFPEVNHKDERKENNTVENLEWVTKKTNMNHGTRTERANKKKFKKVCQYTKDGTLVKVWDSLKDAEKLGYHHSAISECCYGKRNLHQGYKWGWAS